MDDIVYDPKGNEAFGCTSVCLKNKTDVSVCFTLKLLPLQP